MLAALIPAHNEAATIVAAIRGLQAQTQAPDQIIVIADNCTDDTESLARGAGATVYATQDNTDKKAGGLNQTLALLLPTLEEDDLVFIQDADSVVVPEFLELALAALADERVGAVGGIFRGVLDGTLVGRLQDNEYARYAWDIDRKGGKASVLTGTATLHRVSVLREILRERGRRLPYGGGQVYDTTALTEDNEVTFAIKTLGYRCVSPTGCVVHTEVMPTWRDLFQQRLRWQRGALENIRHYGLTRTMVPYIAQQSGMFIGMVGFLAYLLLTALITAQGLWDFSPWWTVLGAVFMVERLVTVWSRGRRARALAALMVPEMFFDLFLQVVLIRSLVDMVLNREAHWHHANVPQTA